MANGSEFFDQNGPDRQTAFAFKGGAHDTFSEAEVAGVTSDIGSNALRVHPWPSTLGINQKVGQPANMFPELPSWQKTGRVDGDDDPNGGNMSDCSSPCPPGMDS